MSEQWSGPLAPPPFWLNPAHETLATDEPPKMAKPEFVLACLAALVALGCDIEQAIGVAANAVSETGWGQKYRGWNLGGVKANKRNATPDSWWWRALGHKQSGDPQTCFYLSFRSLVEFFTYWLHVFAPRHGEGRYAKTGQQFWAGDFWFDDLIQAGYKGEVTKMHPEDSIESFEDICDHVTAMWVQSKVGAKVDGAWGPKSAEAAKQWGAAHNHPNDGKLTRELLWAVSGAKAPDAKRPTPALAAAPRPAKAADTAPAGAKEEKSAAAPTAPAAPSETATDPAPPAPPAPPAAQTAPASKPAAKTGR